MSSTTTTAAILRVARPTRNLQPLMDFYVTGLGLQIISSFDDHEGFDGRILADVKGAPWHLEFIVKLDTAGTENVRAPTADNLLVLYLPDSEAYELRKQRMAENGY